MIGSQPLKSGRSSTLIVPRLNAAFTRLTHALARSSKELRSAGADDARGSAGPVLPRLLRGLPNVLNAWIGLTLIHEAANEAILPDRRADFDEATTRLEAALVQVLRGSVETEREPQLDEVFTGLQAIEVEALAVMGMIVNPRIAYDPTKGDIAPRVVFNNLFIADHLRAEFGRVFSSAMSLRLALERLAAGPMEPREMTDAQRAKRYRARKRRRVVYQATIDVYDTDLALLRSFGFIAPSERQHEDLVTKQLEAFLLHGFLTYPHARTPWRDRAVLQRGRIQALSERENANDPQ